MNLFPLLLGALALSACAGEVESDTTLQLADTLVVSSDPELREMATGMLPDLAARSGLALREPVRLERRTREELQRYLRAKLDEQLSEERARHLTTVYSLLGLMEGDVDLRELLLSVYQEQVAGFYDPDSTALFVMADQGGETLEPVLLHELVHAVQDQWMDLSAATSPEIGNDRSTAAQAAIEGHAYLVMLEYVMEAMQGRAVDLTEIPDFSGQMQGILETARSSYPELARAPRIIQEGMLFPYLEGAGFVLDVWMERGTREGGFEALVPASTEQVLDPSRFLSDPPDAPTPLEVVPVAGTVRYSDGLGAAEVRILLEEVVSTDAGAAVEGWDGDRYVLITGESGSESLAWASIWDDETSRDRFVEVLRRGVDSFPRGATLEPIRIGERPGALLVVGDAPVITVSTVVDRR